MTDGPSRDECIDAAAKVLAQIWLDLPRDAQERLIDETEQDAA